MIDLYKPIFDLSKIISSKDQKSIPHDESLLKFSKRTKLLLRQKKNLEKGQTYTGLIVLAKPLDKHGTTPVCVTYPHLNFFTRGSDARANFIRFRARRQSIFVLTILNMHFPEIPVYMTQCHGGPF